MMWREIHDRLNTLIVRFTVDGIDDTGGIQQMWGRGRYRELYGSAKNAILRHQPAGLSSNPSAGVGVILNMGGNADQSLALALENPASRPTGLQTGETILYSEHGSTVKLDQAGDIHVTAAGGRTIYLEGNVVITGTLHVEQAVTTDAGIHDQGVNVGSTHVHGGVQGGSDNSGPPH